MTYPVTIRVFLGLVPTSIKEDGGTLLLSSGDDILNPLLALGGDNGTQIGTLFESTINVESLSAVGDFRKPLFRLADHDEGAQCHAALASSTESGAGDGVQSMVLVAVWQDGGVVLGSKVGLDTLAVGRATGVDVLSGTVAADEADGLDGWLVDDEVDGPDGAVDDVDDTIGESGLLG